VQAETTKPGQMWKLFSYSQSRNWAYKDHSTKPWKRPILIWWWCSRKSGVETQGDCNKAQHLQSEHSPFCPALACPLFRPQFLQL
jgi:hypothetical protein